VAVCADSPGGSTGTWQCVLTRQAAAPVRGGVSSVRGVQHERRQEAGAPARRRRGDVLRPLQRHQVLRVRDRTTQLAAAAARPGGEFTETVLRFILRHVLRLS